MGFIEILLVLVIVTDLALLGASRINSCIRFAAAQGILLGVLTLVSGAEGHTLRGIALAIVSAGVKGVLFPALMTRAIREARVRREIEPVVGYTTSVLVGVASLAVSLWISSRLPLVRPAASTLVVPTAFTTILVGLFLILSRKKALNQVTGYLVLENGIYSFGVALVEAPFLVELGVLLDVFVAVFVMGITIFHINRTFDRIDTDLLSSLKD
ncbi:hydrogenase [bacterium]|nr:hydrogenase [bacterium]